jgi:uncharacterized SAM-binding protein YcdF (DUF218 family)
MSGNRKWRIFFCVLAVVAAIIFLANAGKMLVVETPAPSDVIVVLAGETDRRPARAIELLDQGFARRIILNVPAQTTLYEFTQLELARRYVQHLPQASAISICPIDGLSTRDEARDVRKCLTQEDGKRVLLVTSDFHTRRALSIFRHEIPGRVFCVAGAEDATQFGTRWWTHRQWAKTFVDEGLRWLWWKTVDQWR